MYSSYFYANVAVFYISSLLLFFLTSIGFYNLGSVSLYLLVVISAKKNKTMQLLHLLNFFIVVMQQFI